MSAPRIALRLLCATLLAGLFAGRVAAQKDGDVRWRFKIGQYVYASPAVSSDGGTIYIAAWNDSTPNTGNVFAIGRDATLKWQFPPPPPAPQIDRVESSPGLSPDGKTIYFGCGDGKLYALDTATGLKKAEFNSHAAEILNSPTVGADGTVYIISSDLLLHALSPDLATERWTHAASYSLSIDTSVAIASDGTLYIGAFDQNVYALDPASGADKWKSATGAAILTSPVLGPDGTIYVGLSDNHLAAVTRDGVKWRFAVGDLILSAPSVAADGTIYFGATDNFFYAVNPDSSLKWKVDLRAGIISTPAVRGDGTIIFGANDNLVHALSPVDGATKWTARSDDYVQTSPAVAPDGSVYFGSFDGRLYSLYGTAAPLSGLSSWPMFNHDAAHSGRTTIGTGNAYLVNLSTLAPRAGGASNLIAGFVVRGSAPKNFLLRAVGPTLGRSPFNVPGVLPDPALSLVLQDGPEVAANGDWGDDFLNVVNATNGVTFPLGAGEKDSALAVALVPGNYSAVVRSVDGGVGAALVEAYDLQAGSGASRLVNISTRAQSSGPVGPLTAGLVIGGSGSLRVLIRAIGPGLAQFGVSGFLTQPRLRVFDASNTLIGTYAGWVASGLTEDLAVAARQTGAFALSPTGAAAADAAAVVTLVPGLYTIQVSGVDGGAGEALVEVYVLP